MILKSLACLSLAVSLAVSFESSRAMALDDLAAGTSQATVEGVGQSSSEVTGGATYEGLRWSSNEVLRHPSIQIKIANGISVTVSPAVAEALLVTGAVVLTGASVYFYVKNNSEVRRRYRDAANQANQALGHNDPNPISSAEDNSSLRRVAGFEQHQATERGEDASKITEVELAQIIVLRSQMLEAQAAAE